MPKSNSSSVTINGGAMTKWLTQDHHRLAFHLVKHGVEGLLGGAILYQFDGKEEAEAAHVAD